MTEPAGAAILPPDGSGAAQPLHPAQAKRLLKAEQAVEEAMRLLNAAKKKRKEIREEYREQLSLDQVVEVGGVAIKVSVKSTGPSFRIVPFLERHQLTDEMKPFYGEPTEYEHWHVKDVTPPEVR